MQTFTGFAAAFWRHRTKGLSSWSDWCICGCNQLRISYTSSESCLRPAVYVVKLSECDQVTNCQTALTTVSCTALNFNRIGIRKNFCNFWLV